MVGAPILLIVVDVGIEVWEVSVQVHPICIVPAKQIIKTVWALQSGKDKKVKIKVSDGIPDFLEHCVVLFRY